jgi:hypothetical protein
MGGMCYNLIMTVEQILKEIVQMVKAEEALNQIWSDLGNGNRVSS